MSTFQTSETSRYDDHRWMASFIMHKFVSKHTLSGPKPPAQCNMAGGCCNSVCHRQMQSPRQEPGVCKMQYLGPFALEQGIHKLESPLQAAGLDVRIRGQRLLQLVHLACWQRGRSTGLLQRAVKEDWGLQASWPDGGLEQRRRVTGV